MSITNFVPTIWSENLLSALDKQYVAVSHCNRDYEGEIKNKGAIVKICGVGEIAINNYTKNSDMSNPQPLNDTATELYIDRAKYFNFQIDDVDKTQCIPKYMDAAMKLAAKSLANEADKYVLSLVQEAGTVVNCDMSSDDLLDSIIKAREILYENNVSDATDVVLEVSPKIATEIFKKKLSLSYCDPTTVDTGYLGSIVGCKIYVSNNIMQERDEISKTTQHRCIMRTTRAVTFAEQFSEITAYRPEKRFADAVKGLHLFGAKVIYPSEMINLCFIYHDNQ